MNNSSRIVRIYGITKDSNTSDFMMVMDYAKKGNLRQKLNSDFNSLSWNDKLVILYDIAIGLKDIHEKELTHRDFHCGNISVALKSLNNSKDITLEFLNEVNITNKICKQITYY